MDEELRLKNDRLQIRVAWRGNVRQKRRYKGGNTPT